MVSHLQFYKTEKLSIYCDPDQLINFGNSLMLSREELEGRATLLGK